MFHGLLFPTVAHSLSIIIITNYHHLQRLVKGCNDGAGTQILYLVICGPVTYPLDQTISIAVTLPLVPLERNRNHGKKSSMACITYLTALYASEELLDCYPART